MIGNDALNKLPMFATDQQIAIAIVGKDRASFWLKTALPALVRNGFPPIDPLHHGRPVPLIKKFYDGYLGVVHDFASKGASGEENWDAWEKRPRFSKKTLAEKTNAGPIKPEELEEANRRREKSRKQREERLALMKMNDQSDSKP